jgi:lipoyl(octanoyl) transferase
MKQQCIIKQLGRQPYLPTWEAMRAFTENRDENIPDELWLLEHDPVFTLGQAGKIEHILNAHNIPIVESDRGGQVTYHGPGQLVAYCLFDVTRLGFNTREFVVFLENAIIKTLAGYGITARGDRCAPGVYVGDEKIASIGLRLKKGRAYHGIALNVHNDLTPFLYINPCGIAGQKVTSLTELGCHANLDAVAEKLAQQLIKKGG